MKILMLLSRVPYPLEKGDKLRAFHQLKQLSVNHKVVLCCLNDEPLHPDAVQALRPYCEAIKIIKLNRIAIFWRMIKGIFSHKPFQIGYFYSRSAQKEVDDLIATYMPKHIYCQLIRVAEYAKKYTIFSKTLDYMDTFSTGMERRYENAKWPAKSVYKIEAERLKEYERDIFKYFDVCSIISEQDRALLSFDYEHKIKIIPNGVDTNYFKPNDTDKDFEILFIGNMSYPPNVEGACFLAKEILPLVRKQLPNTRLLISGVSPSKKVKELESKSVIVGGWIDDIRDSYSRSMVFVAPLNIGTGLQNKLLEAMSMKLPCVTSRLANNALGASSDQILIGETAEMYAKHVIDLLKDPVKSDFYARNGQQFIQDNFSWRSNTNYLESLMVDSVRD